MSEPLQSLSLYCHSGPKALLEPCSAASAAFFRNYHHQNNKATSSGAGSLLFLQQAQQSARGTTALRFKFVNDPRLWQYFHDASVRSHKVFLDILATQQSRGMQFICCADLNLRGTAAGTHFFQNVATEQGLQPQEVEATRTIQEEMACLQLANSDKIRFIQLPAAGRERERLGQIIMDKWGKTHGASRADKYGVVVYKLGHCPWYASETSKDRSNVDARKLVIAILSEMDQHG